MPQRGWYGAKPEGDEVSELLTIRDKDLVRRLKVVADSTGQPAQRIVETAVAAFIDDYEAAVAKAEAHLAAHPDVVASLRGGRAAALRELLDRYEGTRLKSAE
jgi:hypothetical protein